MMRDADSHAEEDKRKREMIENKNRLDSLIYQTEKTINDNREKIPVGLISETETAIAEAKKVIEANDSAQFSSQLDNLTRVSHRIAEALYQQQPSGGATDAASAGAQSQSGQSGGSGKSSGSDDVIDAEYIDVDEHK
jgi:molecular chaperone DnaK